MATAGTSSSAEKTALDKILLAMKENESDLTPQLRDLLAQHQQVDAREEAKVMHRVVASKAAAKKELHKLRAARCSYVQAWSAYLDQILTTVQSQVEEHTATMAEYATKEGQSEQALQEAASALTRMATDGPQAISDEDEEKDIEFMEARTDEAAASEAQTQKVVEQVTAKGAELVEALSKVRGQALEEATKEQGRERTPRRKAAQEGTLPPGKAS